MQCARHARVVAWRGRDAEQRTDGCFVSAGIPPQAVPSSVHKVIVIRHRQGERCEPKDEKEGGTLVFDCWGVGIGFSGGVCNGFIESQQLSNCAHFHARNPTAVARQRHISQKHCKTSTFYLNASSAVRVIGCVGLAARTCSRSTLVVCFVPVRPQLNFRIFRMRALFVTQHIF